MTNPYFPSYSPEQQYNPFDEEQRALVKKAKINLIVSIFAGCIGIISVVGIILAILSLSKLDSGVGAKGRKYAIATIVVCTLWLGLAGLVGVARVIGDEQGIAKPNVSELLDNDTHDKGCQKLNALQEERGTLNKNYTGAPEEDKKLKANLAAHTTLVKEIRAGDEELAALIDDLILSIQKYETLHAAPTYQGYYKSLHLMRVDLVDAFDHCNVTLSAVSLQDSAKRTMVCEPIGVAIDQINVAYEKRNSTQYAAAINALRAKGTAAGPNFAAIGQATAQVANTYAPLLKGSSGSRAEFEKLNNKVLAAEQQLYTLCTQ